MVTSNWASARDYLLDLITNLKMFWAESLSPDSEPVGVCCGFKEIYTPSQYTLQNTKEGFKKCQINGSKPGDLNKRHGHFQLRPAEYL